MTGGESDEVRLLAEIARWTRLAALPLVRERVQGLLDTDGKKRVYAEMASGRSSLMAIERLTGVNHNDVRRWLDAWELEGIVEPDSSPPRASFTLRELAIAPPPPRAVRETRDSK